MENQDLEGQIKWLKNIVKENSKTLFTNGSHYKRQLKVIKTDLEEIYTLEKLNQLLSTPPTEDKIADAKELNEAIEMLHEFPNIDDFVCRNVKQYMSGGEPTDNSIELVNHWGKGLKLVIQLGQSQPDNQFLKGIEYAIRHFDVKDPEALLKAAQSQS